jgi:hypothetical protein
MRRRLIRRRSPSSSPCRDPVPYKRLLVEVEFGGRRTGRKRLEGSVGAHNPKLAADADLASCVTLHRMPVRCVAPLVGTGLSPAPRLRYFVSRT